MKYVPVTIQTANGPLRCNVSVRYLDQVAESDDLRVGLDDYHPIVEKNRGEIERVALAKLAKLGDVSELTLERLDFPPVVYARR
ncbi:hypothetical protein [Achromobacter xylosoxidans]|uniref:hypothetical protein n=1 Tax=Alcaligenes xylosoxydans xylosoxydans TaxID=85698 RepID=UPI001EEBE409|nr:hypothetical protein [Achromobacter xylosoxidans]